MTFTDSTPYNAWVCAHLSQDAYLDPAHFGEVVVVTGQGAFHFFDKNDTQAYLYGDGDVVVLAFRGTQPTDLRDWMTDTDAKLVPGGHPVYRGLVHQGFENALDDVWGDILVAMIPHAEKRLFVTGHSLGGALATLAAARFATLGHKVSGLYTFGSPRVGDPAFCAAFDALGLPAYRYVNDLDVVPRVPTRLMGYSHIGKLMYFGPDGMVTPDDSLWDQFLLNIRGTVDDFLDPRNAGTFLFSHAVANYVENCRKNL